MKKFLKISKLFFLFLIINYSLLIANLYSQQWQVYTTSNSQLPSNLIGTIEIDTNNIEWIGTNNGLVKINGSNWTVYDTNNTPLPINDIFPRDIDKNNNVWVSLPENGMAKFDGFNWQIFDTLNSGINTDHVISISVDENNIKWIGTTIGVTKFNDVNWTVYNPGNSGLPTNIVTSIALENNIKWIGTFSSSGGMAKYNDTNWTVYNHGNSGLPANTIRNIRIDEFGNKWICMDVGGLAKFNSSVNVWTVYNTGNSGLPSNDTYCITFKNRYFKIIGTLDEGLAIFNDTTWQVFNTGNSPLPNNDIRDIKVDKSGKIWIATLGGLAVYTPAPLGINNQNTSLPNQFQLFQNYPNPFNPTTVITYQLRVNSNVSIKIFDITGKEIIELVNNKQNAGKYSINFNGENLPSGIYFYALNTGEFSETKKMVLLK